MFRTLSRMLVATATVVVVGLAPSLVTPAQAGTAPTSVPGSAATRPNTTTEVTARSVSETRDSVSRVLAANDAAHTWPAVDADLTPKLDAAVAAGGGTATTSLLDWLPKIKIKCEITFPPLQIKCTIEIIWG
jgi:hypothetical protein